MALSPLTSIFANEENCSFDLRANGKYDEERPIRGYSGYCYHKTIFSFPFSLESNRSFPWSRGVSNQLMMVSNTNWAKGGMKNDDRILHCTVRTKKIASKSRFPNRASKIAFLFFRALHLNSGCRSQIPRKKNRTDKRVWLTRWFLSFYPISHHKQKRMQFKYDWGELTVWNG